MPDEPTTMLSVRLPKSDHEELKRMAERDDRPVSWEIRRAIQAHIAADQAEAQAETERK